MWQAYLHLNQHLYAFLEQQLVPDGLSEPDYKVLHPLSEAPGGLLRARELGTEIGWDRSRLSHHLTRMEKRGLIAREECAEDGRGLMVRVTDAGRRAIEAAAPAHVENVQRYFFELQVEEMVDQGVELGHHHDGAETYGVARRTSAHSVHLVNESLTHSLATQRPTYDGENGHDPRRPSRLCVDILLIPRHAFPDTGSRQLRASGSALRPRSSGSCDRG